MSLSLGIIGLPQAGKTTLFGALTRLEHDAAAQTQKPNLARVPVPDERLDRLSEHHKPKKTTHATVDFVDVAATGADTEEKGGLGKRVLGQFRTVEALIEVVRCFPHPYLGEPRPLADLESLELELLVSDLGIVENTLDRNRKMPPAAREWFEKLRDVLQEGRRPEPGFLAAVPEPAKPFAQSMSLLLAKPSIVCANVSESLLGRELDDPGVKALEAWADAHGRHFFTVCAKIEEEIAQLAPEEAREFMQELDIKESGLAKLIQASYGTLDLMTFFTVGEDECRAWTVHRGATAPESAGKIHSDLEKGFIRAEVYTYDDFVAHPTMAQIREKGLLRLEGKQYVVQDGDILNIRFNV